MQALRPLPELDPGFYNFQCVDQSSHAWRKTPQALARIKACEGPAEIHRNFLSPDELDELRSFRDLSFNDANSVKRRTIRSDGSQNLVSVPRHEVKSLLWSFLERKLQSWLKEPFVLTQANFYHSHKHPGIHADAGTSAEDAIYKMGIIPLDWAPLEFAHTILFDQRYYFVAEFLPPILDHRSFRNPRNPVPANDYGLVEGYLPGREFNSQHLQDYFINDDFHRRWLKGFSIHKVYEWTPLSGVVFDRSMIHCGSLKPHDCGGNDFKSFIMWQTVLASP